MATAAAPEREAIVGVARYIRLPRHPEVAEFAVVVGDNLAIRHIIGRLAAGPVIRTREGNVLGVEFPLPTREPDVVITCAEGDTRRSCDDRRVRWKLTERRAGGAGGAGGPRIHRSSFDDISRALDALEARGRELSESAPREPYDAKFRRFEPQQRVIARLELAGPERFVPSVRAGVDVRGDGSVEAFRGRVRREVIDPRGSENPYAALRRVLTGG